MAIETRFGDLLSVLSDAQVSFILIGGLAGMAHGSNRSTLDVTVVYDRSDENITMLCDALAPLSPYLRGAPAGLPFAWDEATIRSGLNFTLTTDYGDIDLLGEVVGGGDYDALEPHSAPIQIFDTECQCVSLRKLIELKTAAGRPRDLEAIAELELLLEQQNESS